MSHDEPSSWRTVGEPIGLADFDPHRLRSNGILDEPELNFCRRRGIELAYDPVQIGWVTAACTDDINDIDPQELTAVPQQQPTRPTTPSGPSGPSAPSAFEALMAAFDEEARRVLRSADLARTDPRSTSKTLWDLSESLLRDADGGDPTSRLAMLRRLQAHAHDRTIGRTTPSGERARRRHSALIGGHPYVLRRWMSEEAAEFCTLLDDPAIWQHLPEDYPNPLTESMARDLIEISNESKHHEVRAIEKKGRIVGQIRMLFDNPHGSNSIDGDAHTDAEISYWVGTDFWGKGIASEVIAIYSLLSFWTHPIDSIFARVLENNVASLRALERAHYRDEGDLATELGGDPTIRTLRCFRADYLDENSVRTSHRRRSGLARSAGTYSSPGVA